MKKEIYFNIKRYNYYLFLILFLCISCKKLRLNETTVTGKVINIITNEPIDNADVYVLETKSTDLLSKYEYDEFPGQTDDDGKYSIDFKAGGRRFSYEIRFKGTGDNRPWAQDEDYKNSIEYYKEAKWVKELDKNNENYINLFVGPIGYFYLYINNINPYDEKDLIIVKEKHEVDGVYANEYSLTGKNPVFYSNMDTNRLEGNYIITWTVTKNNMTESYSGTFSIVQGQSTSYTINY